MAIKSTKTLGYNLTGVLDFQNMTISEVTEEEEIVHDLEELLKHFDGQEIKMAFSHKIKLDEGVQ